MTSRQARTERREAERKAKKAEMKRTKAAEAEIGLVSQPAPSRAEINRANAQHSTGPLTSLGKLASSRNSLKHGLASGELIIPGEDRAAFEALLQDLLEEHRPANPTEELLISEMAQSYWLAQRAIRFQNECFTEHAVDGKRLSLFVRYQTTHDRAFHKALSTLLRLKQNRARQQASPARGFVSQSVSPCLADDQFVRKNAPSVRLSDGFVSQNPAELFPTCPAEASQAA